MIVQPDFLDHWKTRRLVALRSGDESASNIVLRLWAFCQTRRKWRFTDLTDEDLDAICRAMNVKTHLIRAGFLHERNGTLVVHDWEISNSQLITSWKNGTKGGRPNKPVGIPRQTQAKPSETQPSNLIISNQKYVPITNSTNNSTKARASSKEEVTEYCLKKGLKKEDGEWFFFHCVGNGWTNKGQPIRDWKATLRTWRIRKFLPSQNPQRSLPFSEKKRPSQQDEAEAWYDKTYGKT